jgi:class 3 adenylate cyclase
MSADEPQTFIFADLAGYTALTEAHGDEEAADAAASFERTVRVLLEKYDAQQVKAIGDALMLRSADPAAAVLLAREIARLGARHGALGVRVGMHTGRAVRRADDWFGATVNVAARVADRACAHEVLMTAATRDAVVGLLAESDLQPRGPEVLKNVTEPVDLFALRVSEQAGSELHLDPVCRMAVDPGLAYATEVVDGVTYYLCSPGCVDSFTRDPTRYGHTNPPEEPQ